jgi:hypothetical protein
MLMGKGFLLSLAVLAGTFWVSATSAQKQFPIMDELANRVIQKYQQSSCEQLRASGVHPRFHRCNGPFNCCAMIRRCGARLATE